MAFLQGLQQLGWTVGRNVRINTRWTAGDPDRARKYAAELVALEPDVVLAEGTTVLGLLLQATLRIPIVFVRLPIRSVAASSPDVRRADSQSALLSLLEPLFPQTGRNGRGTLSFHAARHRQLVEPWTSMPESQSKVYRVQLGKTRTGAERRLTAILAADVAGYSRLVENDEEGTLTQWKAHWHALIEPKIKEFHGRIVRVIGDGVLVEFASVVDAVRGAVEVQRGMAARNAEVPHDKQIEFRMGINFGELIIDGRDFWGDAVNIAARLEALAEPGGICVSGRVQEDVKGKLDIVFEDAGEQQLKNIARSVRVYRIRTGSGVPTPPVIQRKPRAARSRLRGGLVAGGLVAVALLVLLGGGERVWQLVSHLFSLSQVIREVQAPALLPDKRSIAVLPFLNMSSDPEQEYFSDGMTEDLITELSRLTGLLVIARNSVYTFKGRAVKPDQVSRELGVRYVVEGSVRKANNRIRITAQLIDADTGYHMWAQYYDRDLHDVFAVQEEIARRITSALAVKLTKEEEKHMGRPYTSSEVAWEYFMRGAELYRRFTPKDNANARDLFEKAIDLDPEFARAYASLAATHRQDYYWEVESGPPIFRGPGLSHGAKGG